jgi:hypothetical protein
VNIVTADSLHSLQLSDALSNSDPPLVNQNIIIQYHSFTGPVKPILPDYLVSRMVLASAVIDLEPNGARITGLEGRDQTVRKVESGQRHENTRDEREGQKEQRCCTR